MSDLWIIKDVATERVLHYFDEEFLANEKLQQLNNATIKILIRLANSNELQEFEPSEVSRCVHCGEIINVRGQWTWLIHASAYAVSNGTRCGRCKSDH